MVTVKDSLSPNKNFTFFQPLNSIDALITFGNTSLLNVVYENMTSPAMINGSSEYYLQQFESSDQVKLAQDLFEKFRNNPSMNMYGNHIPITMNIEHNSIKFRVSRQLDKFASEPYTNAGYGKTLQQAIRQRKMTRPFGRNTLRAFELMGYRTASSPFAPTFEIMSPFNSNFYTRLGSTEMDKGDTKFLDEVLDLHSLMPGLFGHPLSTGQSPVMVEKDSKRQKIDITVPAFSFDENTEITLPHVAANTQTGDRKS